MADLSERMKNGLIRTKDQTQNLTDDAQNTPSEYAGDKLQGGMEEIAAEGGHIVVDTGKGVYRAGKSAIQKFREKRALEATQRQKSMENEFPDSPVENQTGSRHSASGSHSTTSPRPNVAGRTPLADAARDTVRRTDRSIKSVQKTEKSIRQVSHATEQTAKTIERSVKDTQRVVKTAEQTSRVAIKTAQETAKATQKTAQTAAKASKKAAEMAKATAEAAAKAARLLQKPLPPP